MHSVYLSIYVLVAILAIVTLRNPIFDKILYLISFGMMTLLLVLRFGQGTDYPQYMCIYETANIVFDPMRGFLEYLEIIHSEIGWKCLMIFFQFIKADFWVVTAVLAIFTMWCTHLAITKFCMKYKTVALIILFPTVYLTYYFSTMRQGLAMAVFFGILLDKLLHRKYIQYIVGVLLIGTIHSASLCYLLIPLILVVNKKLFNLGIVLSVLTSVSMLLAPVRELIDKIAIMIGASSSYFESPTISWFSFGERLVMLILVLTLLWNNEDNQKIKERVQPIMRIYLVGFFLYTCLMTNAFIASRLAIMFKMSEFILIPMLFEGVRNKLKNYCVLFLMSLSAVMTYKNLNSYVEQGNYFDGINGWNYPYVTIFNREDILEYRKELRNGAYDFKESDYF